VGIDIKFEVENQPERSGVVAENSYLWDCAKRLGVHLKAECQGRGECKTCAVTVKEGAQNLTSPTAAALKILSDERRAGGERLACQARIERGDADLLVFVRAEVEEEVVEEKERDFRKDFQELPFEKKFATLVQLEAVALSETLNYVSNLPSFVVSKVMDVMGQFGLKMEQEKRAAQRPAEHQTDGKKNAEAASANGKE
jgi:ferredoxin